MDIENNLLLICLNKSKIIYFYIITIIMDKRKEHLMCAQLHKLNFSTMSIA